MFQVRKMGALIAAAVVVVSGCLSPGARGSSGATPPLALDVLAAKLTAAHGNVLSRHFVDREQRTEMSPWKAAGVNDELLEGAHIATGDNSWAEVTWPSVKTRAWANSVFSIAPRQRLVYLTSGELLFQLDKNKKIPYRIETNVLQARIRGTTVMVQATGNVTRISVLEGKIDVFNLKDHSSVTITPGVVYEARGFDLPRETGRPTALPHEKGIETKMQDICYDSAKPVPLFQNSKGKINVYAANRDSLVRHPLVSEAGGVIPSMGLIQEALSGKPGFTFSQGGAAPRTAGNAVLDRLVFDNVRIKAVPSKADYWVGQAVGREIQLPPIAYMDLQPAGVVRGVDRASSNVATVPVRPPVTISHPFVLPFPYWDPAANYESSAPLSLVSESGRAPLGHSAGLTPQSGIRGQIDAQSLSPMVIPPVCAGPAPGLPVPGTGAQGAAFAPSAQFVPATGSTLTVTAPLGEARVPGIVNSPVGSLAGMGAPGAQGLPAGAVGALGTSHAGGLLPDRSGSTFNLPQR